jgi:hypothetical protein
MAMQMLFEVAVTVTAPPNDAAGQSNYRYPMRHVNQYFREDTMWSSTLNQPTCLCPEVVITWPPCQNGHVTQGENTDGADSEVPPPVPSKDMPLHLIEADETLETSATKKGKHVAFTLEPTHPYVTVPNTTYDII